MKILCVGKNYKDHVKEMGEQTTSEPILFLKPETSLMTSDTFYIPEYSNEVHYEVEVVIKICKAGKYISSNFAKNYYEQIGLGLDFTLRDLQREYKTKGLPWDKAKAFDNAACAGGFVPVSDFQDIQNLNFSLKKNREIVQRGNTSEMIHQIDYLISHISKFFTIKKGDLIYTGTPSGVGRIDSNNLLEGYLENKKCFSIKIL